MFEPSPVSNASWWRDGARLSSRPRLLFGEPAAASLLVAAAAALLALAGPAAAATVRTGQRVYVASDTTIEEDLYAAGREVIIEGVVRGDVLATGSAVTIRGRVEGSLTAVGGTVFVDGAIARTARLAGGEVRIGGEVGRDALAACGSCTLAGTGKVGADFLAAGGEVHVAGTVARSLNVSGKQVRLTGTTGTEARVRAEALRVEESAAVPSLLYGTREAAHIPLEAHILHVETHPEWVPVRESRLGRSLMAALMALVTGVVLLWLSPVPAARAAQLLAKRPAAALRAGLIVALLAPLLIVLGMVTAVGLPLSLFAAALYLFGMYLGCITSAYVVGDILLRKVHRPENRFAYLTLGVFSLMLVSLIPGVGAVLIALLTLAGFGGLWLLLWESHGS